MDPLPTRPSHLLDLSSRTQETNISQSQPKTKFFLKSYRCYPSALLCTRGPGSGSLQQGLCNVQCAGPGNRSHKHLLPGVCRLQDFLHQQESGELQFFWSKRQLTVHVEIALIWVSWRDESSLFSPCIEHAGVQQLKHHSAVKASFLNPSLDDRHYGGNLLLDGSPALDDDPIKISTGSNQCCSAVQGTKY